MSDLRSLLDQGIGAFQPQPDPGLDRTLRRVRQRVRTRRLVAGGVALGLFAIAVGLVSFAILGRSRERPAAGAANGRLLFVGQSGSAVGIYTMAPDGSDLRRLPLGSLRPWAAAWSPDGTRLAVMASRPVPTGHLPVIRMYAMNADGSDLRPVPACPDLGCQGIVTLSWSPDGTRIAFQRVNGEIDAADVRTGQVRALTTGHLDSEPAWSPDGTRIAFERDQPGARSNGQIWVMNADGTGARQLTHSTTSMGDASPAWSFDGRRIAFVGFIGRGHWAEVFVMNADGTEERQLTSCPEQGCHTAALNPVWSPDGTAIAFIRPEDNFTRSAIMLMSPDGSDIRLLREAPYEANSLSWQPIGRQAENTPSSFP